MLVATVRYLAGTPDVSYTKPFYDPATFSVAKLSAASSLAVLTYIGFDGISTLSEEVRNPRRNILLGSVLTCLTIGILSAIEVYAAQLVWPSNTGFPDIDTAYVHIAGKAGGMLLFQAVNLTLIVASIGSGSGGMLAGGRLLYGMGRDGALPRSFFGYLHPTRHIPSRNVILIGAICFTGALLLSYERGAELLNFGAFIGFMGVNLSCFLHYWVRKNGRDLSSFVMPLCGLVVCGYLWWNLSVPSKLLGTAWLVVGLIYGAITTQGFRNRLVRFEVPVDKEEHAS
jgi:amino acid transporter